MNKIFIILKLLIISALINISGCGVTNYGMSPVRSVSNGIGNTIGAGFLAARPEQGNYTYPMTKQ